MPDLILLPRNVQFIYEHSLAREELGEGFGLRNISWDTESPWTFKVNLNGQTDEIIRRSAYAGSVNDNETQYSQLIRPQYQGGKFNRTRSVNQYLTHWIYPYKGKFHPQMIRALLNIVGAKPGWLIFEPFCGSGTAALEAQLLGLDVHAIDISPLCVDLTKVKTQAWKYEKEISRIVDIVLTKNIDMEEVGTLPYKSSVARTFFEIARMVTLSDQANRNRNPKVYFPKNVAAMHESIKAMGRGIREFNIEVGRVKCKVDDVRSPSRSTASIQANLIITSPPYSIALDYVKNDEHALAAMGLNTKEIRHNFIGVSGRGIKSRLSRYESDMKNAFRTMSNALVPGGAAVIVIGNVTIQREEVYTTQNFVDWACESGLAYVRELPKIVFGLYNVMADEKIMFFRKE